MPDFLKALFYRDDDLYFLFIKLGSWNRNGVYTINLWAVLLSVLTIVLIVWLIGFVLHKAAPPRSS